MLLMGIAPLSAWGHSTVKTLGRALVEIGRWLHCSLRSLLFFTYTRNIIRPDRLLPDRLRVIGHASGVLAGGAGHA